METPTVSRADAHIFDIVSLVPTARTKPSGGEADNRMGRPIARPILHGNVDLLQRSDDTDTVTLPGPIGQDPACADVDHFVAAGDESSAELRLERAV